MKNEPKGHFRVPVNRQGNTPTSRPVDRHLLQTHVARAGALGLLLVSLCRIAAAQGDSPTQLRRFIDQQVGGIDKLKAGLGREDVIGGIDVEDLGHAGHVHDGSIRRCAGS